MPLDRVEHPREGDPDKYIALKKFQTLLHICIRISEICEHATIIVARISLDLPVDASPLHGEDARPGVHEVSDDLAAGVSHDALVVVALVSVARERGRVF